jgi:hypothetical protein
VEKSYYNILPAIPKKPLLTQAGHDINVRLYFADDSKDELKKISFEMVSTNEVVEKAAQELGKK